MLALARSSRRCVPAHRALTAARRAILSPSSRACHSAAAAAKDKLIIFDTTLRDGEQSPGVTLTMDEKVAIAQQLCRLGVDVCEAGFPIASEGDFESVRRIAEFVGPIKDGRDDYMTICGLARARKGDIDRCYEAVSPAPKSRIHTFLATSDIHLKYKLQISREECLKQISEQVGYAASLCKEVEFSPEDAGRSDVDFLTQCLAVAIEAGATTLNIPDTVGYNLPDHYGQRLKYLIDNTQGSDKAVWSTHCHNDLGLATANSIAGVLAGARQVECTINGIGERAGNTSLEEVVMATYVHSATMPVTCSVDTRLLTSTSQMVSRHSGMVVQPNKSIVGSNAFAHESGIHQDGVLKHQETYEIIRPEVVGLGSEHDGMVLGKLSGRAALKQRLEQLGYPFLTKSALHECFIMFKRMADTKKTISDGDLYAIVRDVLKTDPSAQDKVALEHESGDADTEGALPHWTLEHVSVMSSSSVLTPTTATVTLGRKGGESVTAAHFCSGPINATYKAIDSLVKMPVKLDDFKIHSATAGKDAIGEVVVTLSSKKGAEAEVPLAGGIARKRVFIGVGVDSDIIVASAKAYVNALNSMHSATTRSDEEQERMVQATAAV